MNGKPEKFCRRCQGTGRQRLRGKFEGPPCPCLTEVLGTWSGRRYPFALLQHNGVRLWLNPKG